MGHPVGAGDTGAEMVRRPGWDALRGVAVGLVMIRHAWPQTFGTAGIVGVVLFFVLSGHLITGLLVTEVRGNGRVLLTRFYLHRAVRLIPALVVMLAVCAAISLVFRPLRETNGAVLWGVFKGATYTANVPGLPGSPVFGHLWTLSTEEQFYLVWPWMVLLMVRSGHVRLWAGVVLAATFGVLVAYLLLSVGQVLRVYSSPFGWIIGIVLGSLAWFARDGLWREIRGAGCVRRALPSVSIGLLAAICFIPENKGSPWTYLVLGPAISVLAVFIVLRAGDIGPVGKWWTPWLLLGRVSYAAYLWNLPIVLWIKAWGWGPGWVQGLVSVAATVVAAATSWVLVERPAQRMRVRLDSRWGKMLPTGRAST